MPATRSEFRNYALLSGLVTADQLEQAVLTAGVADSTLPVDQAGASAAEIDDGRIANRLVEMGILTPFQATQIKAGRTKFALGPYVVTDSLGQGGMGQVFKGVHQVMGRECAIKVLPLHKATSDAIAIMEKTIKAYDHRLDDRVRAWAMPFAADYATPELLLAAKRLADQYQTGLTLHQSNDPPSVQASLQKYGKRPIEYLEGLGVLGPNVLLIATSAASRPRAISTRPIRGVLWRASKVYQSPSSHTSNQAEKSIGASTGGIPMSPR